jgi:hypothetical protein
VNGTVSGSTMTLNGGGFSSLKPGCSTNEFILDLTRN